jgi:hypothetical protein
LTGASRIRVFPIARFVRLPLYSIHSRPIRRDVYSQQKKILDFFWPGPALRPSRRPRLQVSWAHPMNRAPISALPRGRFPGFVAGQGQRPHSRDAISFVTARLCLLRAKHQSASSVLVFGSMERAQSWEDSPAHDAIKPIRYARQRAPVASHARDVCPIPSLLSATADLLPSNNKASATEFFEL